jgi:hypothetical protein
VTDAVAASASTYDPARPDYTVEDFLTLLDLGLWDPTSMTTSADVRHGGGYSSTEQRYSPNGWHPVHEVREGIGVPPWEFDRLWAEVRTAYRLTLDSAKMKDSSLIHGQEIEAIRRRWAARKPI